MSEWIKKIKDHELVQLAQDDHLLHDVPPDIDEIIVRTIRKGKSSSQGETHGKTYIPYLLAAAIIVLVSIPVTYFVMHYLKGAVSTVTLVAGNGEVKRGENLYALQPRDNLVRGNSVALGDRSTCMIQIGEKIIVKVFDKSKITLGELRTERVVLYLDYGRILVNAERASERTDIEIRREHHVLYAGRSTYYIEYNDDDSTIIAAGKGGGKISESVTFEDYTLDAHSYTLIKKDEIPLRSPLPSEMEALLYNFSLNETIKDVGRSSTLIVNTSLDDVILTINGTHREEFSQSISMSIEPGQYIITIEKSGFITYREEINLSPEKTHIVPIELRKEREEKTIRVWGSEKIYAYAGEDEHVIPEIKGFSISKDHGIALTAYSLVCFDREGSLIWENVYGREEGLLFDSMPVMYNKKVYAASNYCILILDLETGKEIKRIHAPGILSYGYSMSLFHEKLFIPYPEGIYTLDVQKDTMSSEPLIPFESPAGCYITDKGMYLVSFMTNEFCYFNHEGKKEVCVSLASSGFCPPVEVEGDIVTGDITGNLYLYTDRLIQKNRLTIAGSIVSITNTKDDSFYIFTKMGNLYKIEKTSFLKEFVVQVDKKPGPRRYYYKKPVCVDREYLLVGNDTGELIVLHTETGNIEKILALSSFPVSCSAAVFQNKVLTGTEGGEIFMTNFSIE